MGIKFPETKKLPYRIKADVDIIVLTLVKCTKTFPYVKKMLKRYYGYNIYYEIYCKTLKKISKIPYNSLQSSNWIIKANWLCVLSDIWTSRKSYIVLFHVVYWRTVWLLLDPTKCKHTKHVNMQDYKNWLWFTPTHISDSKHSF